MTYAFPPDIRQLVDDALATGHYASEDDVLRDALGATVEQSDDGLDDLTALQEAIDEWQAGDPGIPLKQAFDDIRKELGLPDPM